MIEKQLILELSEFISDCNSFKDVVEKLESNIQIFDNVYLDSQDDFDKNSVVSYDLTFANTVNGNINIKKCKGLQLENYIIIQGNFKVTDIQKNFSENYDKSFILISIDDTLLERLKSYCKVIYDEKHKQLSFSEWKQKYWKEDEWISI